MTEERRKEWVTHIESAWGVWGKDLMGLLESFEREVAEHAKREEREACAVICDEIGERHGGDVGTGAQWAASAIRERNQRQSRSLRCRAKDTHLDR